MLNNLETTSRHCSTLFFSPSNNFLSQIPNRTRSKLQSFFSRFLCILQESSESARGIVTVAFLPVLNQISVLNMDGELSLHQTNQVQLQTVIAVHYLE